MATLFATCILAPINSQADVPKALLGMWELTSMKLEGQSISCPGQLPLPPGVPDTIKVYAKCGAGDFIQLTKRGTRLANRGEYVESISSIPTTSPFGTWSSVSEKRLPGTDSLPEIPAVKYMIFDDYDNTGDPQVYSYVLSRDEKTLTISKSVGLQGPRYKADLIFTKK